ncbi:MAG: hypothetical protein RL757_1882 [Bacteroidota bacterium]
MKFLKSTLFRSLLLMLPMFMAMATEGKAQTAADSCFYRLRIFDSFGDDWDASQLFVRFGNNSEVPYTHIDQIPFSSADSVQFYDIRVRIGDSLVARYVPMGGFQNEIRFTMFDRNGNVVFDSGRPITTSPVWTNPWRSIVSCAIACRAPNAPLSTDLVRGNNALGIFANLSWRPSLSVPAPLKYQVGYDTIAIAGNPRWRQLVDIDTSTTITNLFEKKNYFWAVRSICSPGDTSPWVTSGSFATPWAVELEALPFNVAPIGCNTTSDTLRITIRNNGAYPQSLFRIRYSVNGVVSPLSSREDTIYSYVTGVLSRDSVRTYPFYTLASFPNTGTYNIAVWLEAANDRVISNDTFRYTVVRSRTVASYPYYQDFEAGDDTWYTNGANSSWRLGGATGVVMNTTLGGSKIWKTGDLLYNTNELSYLVSPCLDFSSLATDPNVSFNYRLDAEAGFDGAWLELSTDNGSTWSRVGARNTGLNWYADSIAVYGSMWGNRTNTAWRTASNVLRGVTGRPNCRLRFAFRSDASVQFEGFAMDNFLISTSPRVDLQAVSASRWNTGCLGATDSVRLNISNLGIDTMRTFTANYRLNAGATVSENVTGWALAPGASRVYNFTTSIASVPSGNNTVSAWVTVATDINRRNDTTVLNFLRPATIATFPYIETFETGNGSWAVSDSLGNSTWALATPNGPFFNNAASGLNAWTTLPAGSYNNSEYSYVVSPCLNFSSFASDPRLGMAINVHSPVVTDGAFAEVSTDGGVNWRRIGTRNTGINWYNDSITAISRPVWAGIATTTAGWLPNWRYAQNMLTGTAGQSNVRIRIGYRTDAFTNTADGFAFDNVFIGTRSTTDMALSGIRKKDISICGSATDSLFVTFANAGDTTLSSFVVNYSVDGGATVSETITGLSVLPNRTAIYRFNTTFNSTGLGSHDVKVWITTTGDSIRANDTMMFKYNVQVPIGTFSSYNFNDLRLPLNWTAVTPMTFGTRGASPSDGGIAYRNLFTALARFEMQTNKFGVIRTTDSVSYEYRFVNFSGATATILGTDSVLVQYAFDCEDVWRTADLVTSANHNPSTLFVRRKVSLAAAAGRIIRLRFVAIRGTTGDYYFDIDNINFISCAPNFGLATRFNNTPQGQSRGTAAVTPTNGLPPFTYRWNNTRTTDSIGALPAGIYTVVVTDARGCKDSTTVTVTGTIGTIDPTATIASLKIAPNPTTNNAVLDVEFAKAVDAKVEIVNLMGQTIWSESRRQISQGRFDLDMNDVPAGVYIVRVSADNRSVIAKLVKQ